MAKLTANARKHIAPKNFALSGDRYPIEGKSHAQNALARVSQHGTPEEKSKMRAAVHRKYPDIGKSQGEEIETRPRKSLTEAIRQKRLENHLKRFWRGGKA